MSTDAQNIPGSFAPPSGEELVVAARDAVHRFLGNPTGQAEGMVRELNEDEQTALVDAATDRNTARQAIKDVFTAAQERKRKAHEVEAQADQKRLNERAAVSRVLASTGAPTDAVQHALSVLSAGERSILAQLDGETDIDDVIEAVVTRAMNREESEVEAAELASDEKNGGSGYETEGQGQSTQETSGDVEGSNATAPPGEAPAAEPSTEAAAPPAAAEAPAEAPAVDPPKADATAPADPKQPKKPGKK